MNRTAAAIGLVQQSLEDRNQSRLDELWRVSGGEAQIEALFARFEDLDAQSSTGATEGEGVGTWKQLA